MNAALIWYSRDGSSALAVGNRGKMPAMHIASTASSLFILVGMGCRRDSPQNR
jgi:hypothetical protein